MKATRVLIADDYEIVREGLRALLAREKGLEVCGEAGTGREAVERAAGLQPDVVLMDIVMPELNGLEATRQIKRARPETEILVFTSNETEETVRNVFKAGAKAYLLKSETTRHLVPAITALSAHRTYFSSKVSELIFASYLGEGKFAEAPALTGREREIVQLVAEGKINKEIAVILGVSVKTVEAHRAAIMRKLKLESAAELVRYAIRNGIIPA